MVNRILPRTLHSKIELEFYEIGIKGVSSQSLLLKVQSIMNILINVAKFHKIKKISLPISPLIFPSFFVNNAINDLVSKNLIPYIPLTGLDNEILHNAREIGLGKFLPKIEKYGKINFNKIPKSIKEVQNISRTALKTKKSLTVTLGPNNVHEIMDFMNSNH